MLKFVSFAEAFLDPRLRGDDKGERGNEKKERERGNEIMWRQVRMKWTSPTLPRQR
jgi:hypothetical protein